MRRAHRTASMNASVRDDDVGRHKKPHTKITSSNSKKTHSKSKHSSSKSKESSSARGQTSSKSTKTSPVKTLVPSEMMNSSDHDGSQYKRDKRFKRAKRHLLQDFWNKSDESVNNRFKKHMLSLNKEKQKKQIERLLEQSYFATKGNLKEAKAMIMELITKPSLPFSFPVEPPTLEVMEKIKQAGNKQKILSSMNHFPINKKRKFIEKIIALFGSEYLESDDKFLVKTCLCKSDSDKQTRKNIEEDQIMFLHKKYKLHGTSKKFTRLSINSQSSVDCMVTSTLYKKSNSTQNILKEVRISNKDKLNNNINIQVPVGSETTGIERSNTTIEIIDPTVVCNLNDGNSENNILTETNNMINVPIEYYLNFQKKYHSTEITQMSKNLLEIKKSTEVDTCSVQNHVHSEEKTQQNNFVLEIKNSTEIVNDDQDDKNFKRILSRTNSLENSTKCLNIENDNIIELLESDEDIKIGTLARETNVIDIDVENIGISKNKFKVKSTNAENIHIKEPLTKKIRLDNHADEMSDLKKNKNGSMKNSSTIAKVKSTITENIPFKKPENNHMKTSDSTNSKNKDVSLKNSSSNTSQVKSTNAENKSVGEPIMVKINLNNHAIEISNLMKNKNKDGSIKNSSTISEMKSTTTGNIPIKKPENNHAKTSDSTNSKNKDVILKNSSSTISEVKSTNAENKYVGEPITVKIRLDNYDVEKSDLKKNKNNDVSMKNFTTISEIKSTIIKNIPIKKPENHTVETSDSSNSYNKDVCMKNSSPVILEVISTDDENISVREPIKKKIKLVNNHVRMSDLSFSKNDDVSLKNSSSTISEVESTITENIPIKKPKNHTVESSDSINSKNKDVSLKNSSSTISEVESTNAENKSFGEPITLKVRLDNHDIEKSDLTKNENDGSMKNSTTTTEIKSTIIENIPFKKPENHTVETSDSSNSYNKDICMKNSSPVILEVISTDDENISVGEPIKKKIKLVNNRVRMSDSSFSKNDDVSLKNSSSTISEVESKNAENKSVWEPITLKVRLDNHGVEKSDLTKNENDGSMKNSTTTSEIKSTITENIPIEKPENHTVETSDSTNSKNKDVILKNSSSTISEVKSTNVENKSVGEPITVKIRLDNYDVEKSDLKKNKNNDVSMKNFTTISEIKSTIIENIPIKKPENHTVETSDSSNSYNKDVCMKNSSPVMLEVISTDDENISVREPIKKKIKLVNNHAKTSDSTNSKNYDVSLMNSSSTISEVESTNAENKSVGEPITLKVGLDNHDVEKSDLTKNENDGSMKNSTTTSEIKSTITENIPFKKPENHTVETSDSSNSYNKDICMKNSSPVILEVISTDDENISVGEPIKKKIKLVNNRVRMSDSSFSKNDDVSLKNSSSTISEVESTNAENKSVWEPITLKVRLDNDDVEKSDLTKNENDGSMKNSTTTSEIKSTITENIPIKKPENHTVETSDSTNSKNYDVILKNSSSTILEVKSTNAENKSVGEPITLKIRLGNHDVEKSDLTRNKNNDGSMKNFTTTSEMKSTIMENIPIKKPENHTVEISDSSNSYNKDVSMKNSSPLVLEVKSTDDENISVREPIKKKIKLVNNHVRMSNSTMSQNYGVIMNNSFFSKSDMMLTNAENMSVGNPKPKKKKLENHHNECSNSSKCIKTVENVQPNMYISVRPEYSLLNSFKSFNFYQTGNVNVPYCANPSSHNSRVDHNISSTLDFDMDNAGVNRSVKNNLNHTSTQKKMCKTQDESSNVFYTIGDNPQKFNIPYDSGVANHLSTPYCNTYRKSSLSNIQPLINGQNNTMYSDPVSDSVIARGAAVNTTWYPTDNSQIQSSILSRNQSSIAPTNSQNSTSMFNQSSVITTKNQQTATNNQNLKNYSHFLSSIPPSNQTSANLMNSRNSMSMNTLCNTAQCNRMSSYCNSTSNECNKCYSSTNINHMANNHTSLGLPNTGCSYPNIIPSTLLYNSNSSSSNPVTNIPVSYSLNANHTQPTSNSASSREASMNNSLLPLNNFYYQYHPAWNQIGTNQQQTGTPTAAPTHFQLSDLNYQLQCMAANCTKIQKLNCSYCMEARYCSRHCEKTDWHYHKNECFQRSK